MFNNIQMPSFGTILLLVVLAGVGWFLLDRFAPHITEPIKQAVLDMWHSLKPPEKQIPQTSGEEVRESADSGKAKHEPKIVADAQVVKEKIDVEADRPFLDLELGQWGQMGVQVDAWGAIIFDRAGLYDDGSLLFQTLDVFADRVLPDVRVSFSDLKLGSTAWNQAREHVLIQQKLPTGNLASLALRIADRGKDLEVSWRLSEHSPAKQSALKSIALLMMVGGCMTACIGVPLIAAIGMGVAMITIGIGFVVGGFVLLNQAKKQTLVNAFDQFDSRALAKTVSWCLLQALAANGVTEAQVVAGTLWRNSTSGMGGLLEQETPNPILLGLGMSR